MAGEGPFIKNSLLNISGTFAYFFSQWTTTIVVVQLIGYASAGIFSLVVSFTNIFMFISQFGIRNFQISDVGERYSTSQYFGARIVAITMALIAFCASLIAFNFEYYVVRISLLYIIFKMLETLTDFGFAVFQKYELYSSITISYFLKSIFPLGGFIFVLELTKSLSSAILIMAISYATIIVLYDLRIYKRREALTISFKKTKDILRACFPLMLGTLITPYMVFIARYTIEKIYGKELLGYFSAISMVIVIMTTLASAVWFVIVPKIGIHFHAGRFDKIEGIIVKVCLGIIALGCLAILLGSVFGEWIFGILFNKEILPYMYLLTPVLLTSIILTAAAFFATILIPMQRRRAILISGLAGAAICSITVYPLTRQGGLTGANVSLMLGITTQLIALIAITIHTIREQRKKSQCPT